MCLINFKVIIGTYILISNNKLKHRSGHDLSHREFVHYVHTEGPRKMHAVYTQLMKVGVSTKEKSSTILFYIHVKCTFITCKHAKILTETKKETCIKVHLEKLT